MLQFLQADYINISIISGSKPDSTFPFSRFPIEETIEEEEYYYWENLITRLLSRPSFTHNIEILLTESNPRTKKWLICCCYNPF